MEQGFQHWANPSSPHAAGRKARSLLEDARDRVKAALGWQGEVIFTSGASEAAALALNHAQAGARLVSTVEHDCILQAAPAAERLPVLGDGALDHDNLAEAVQRERPLVAVQQVNSETGNRQDIAAIARLVQAEDGLLLVDCAQGAGRFDVPDCEMAIVSAHKFGGPIGVGALLVKDYAMLAPAGGQERGYRRGTENMPGVLGIYTGADLAADGIGTIPSALPLKNRDGSPYIVPPHPALATGRVRHVGEACAIVVADSAALAEDAVEAVAVELDPRETSVPSTKGML